MPNFSLMPNRKRPPGNPEDAVNPSRADETYCGPSGRSNLSEWNFNTSRKRDSKSDE